MLLFVGLFQSKIKSNTITELKEDLTLFTTNDLKYLFLRRNSESFGEKENRNTNLFTSITDQTFLRYLKHLTEPFKLSFSLIQYVL
jgi:hypothetical protein